MTKITEPMFDYGLSHVGDARLPPRAARVWWARWLRKVVRRDRLGRLSFVRFWR